MDSRRSHSLESAIARSAFARSICCFSQHGAIIFFLSLIKKSEKTVADRTAASRLTRLLTFLVPNPLRLPLKETEAFGMLRRRRYETLVLLYGSHRGCVRNRSGQASSFRRSDPSLGRSCF